MPPATGALTAGATADAPPTNSEDPRGGHPAAGAGRGYLIALAAASIAVMSSVLSVAILTLPLKAESIAGGRATTLISVASGVAGAVALIANPIFGRLSDRTTMRWGRRRPYVVLGAVFMAVGSVLVLQAMSVWMLSIGWVLMTMGQISAQAALGASIPEQLAPERRGIASAVFGVAGTAGALIGLGLGSLLSPSLPAMILAPTALAVLTLLVFAVVLRDRPLPSQERPALVLSEVFGTFWVNPRRHTSYALAFGSRFAVFCSIAAVNAYQAIYLIMGLHIPPTEVAGKIFLASLVSGLTALLFAMTMGKLSDRIGRRKPFVVAAALIFAVGLALVATASTFNGFLVAVAVMGIGQGVYLAVDFALITQVLPDPNNPAKDLGIMNLASSLPNIVVPAVAPALLALGASASSPQNFGALFLAGAVAGLLGAVLIAPIRMVR
ncbi:MFS transporter [Kineococcus rhizosphaerae]|nr:MFS transporter [Kineococcus rhizosphaerae]